LRIDNLSVSGQTVDPLSFCVPASYINNPEICGLENIYFSHPKNFADFCVYSNVDGEEVEAFLGKILCDNMISYERGCPEKDFEVTGHGRKG